MTFKKSLITLSILTMLTACGSDSNKTTKPIEPQVPMLLMELPQDDAAMVEDFPLSLYLTYPDGASTITNVSSIDISWPTFYVHQSNIEHGYIDGASDELFYYTVPIDDSAVIAADDIERQEHLFWYVVGDDNLYQLNSQTAAKQEWSLTTDAQFTELAINEEGANHIWLYDKANHQIVHFNSTTDNASPYALDEDIAINGLAIADDNLAILASNNSGQMVLRFQVDGTQLTQQGAWYLEGFENTVINDLAIMPDGQIAVSNENTENNITLVSDKSELIGNGPIEDNGQLELIDQVALDSAIKQPSGISALEDGSWVLITDQAEMFALDAQFNVVETLDLEFDSIFCNQGCTEAVVAQTDRFYALTDSGLVGQFDKEAGSYQLSHEHQINVVNNEGEAYQFAGMGIDRQAGEFYLVTSQNDEDAVDELVVLNSDFSTKSRVKITYNGETEGSIYSYDAQGVQYYEGFVYVISELYTKLLKINLTGEIVAVYDLDHEQIAAPSDFAIKDGLIYIIGDHENDEPVPPISAYEIDQD